MALHEVLLELALVLSVLPFVVTSSFLFGEVIVALEEVAVVVRGAWSGRPPVALHIGVLIVLPPIAAAAECAQWVREVLR